MRCPVCGGVVDEKRAPWCVACDRMVHRLGTALCPECRRFRPFDMNECVAGHATTAPSAILALGVFDQAWRAIVHGLKYEGRMELADSLGRMFANELGTQSVVDLVLPIPTNARKRRERGFGHAELIAETCARALGVPYCENGLKQTRRIPDQTRLSGAQRMKNMAGAFAVSDPASVAGQTVLIVDDVMTTGATLREAARVVTGAGAAGVLGAVVAVNLESVSGVSV